MKNFKDFNKEKTINQIKTAEMDNKKNPQVLVQPADNDKGYFMFKAAFDKAKMKFVPKISF